MGRAQLQGTVGHATLKLLRALGNLADTGLRPLAHR